jgi:hypothetical protein
MTTNEALINASINTFNEHQRKTLIALSKVSKSNTYMQENKPLEDYIRTLRDMYPEKFHNSNSLKNRVFFDAPTTIIPHASSVRPRSESPYLKDAK